MGRNMSVTCGALALLAATWGVRNPPPAPRACVPAAQPAVVSMSAPALSAGSTEFVAISISPDGRLISKREQPLALTDALHTCVTELGGTWDGDCGDVHYAYTAAARSGYCALVSQTKDDQQHKRIRAILVPPLPAGQAALTMLDTQAQMVVFRQAGGRWSVLSQEPAFLE